MGRAARRQQERAERRAQAQPRTTRNPTSTFSPSAPSTGEQRRGSRLRPRWLTDIISELGKVTWPSRQETTHLTVVVIVVSLLFGVVLGGADLGFGWLIERTLLR